MIRLSGEDSSRYEKKMENEYLERFEYHDGHDLNDLEFTGSLEEGSNLV